MPDPWRYLTAFALTALVASFVPSAARRLLGAVPSKRTTLASCVLGTVAGLAWLGLLPQLPPTTGLDRLLLLVLPAIAAVEWWADGERIGPRCVLARLLVLIAAGPVLLWNSVHLAGNSMNGLPATLATMTASVLLVLAIGTYARAMMHQVPDVAPRIGLGLGLSILVAGILTLLGGYLRGGATGMVLGIAYLATAARDRAAVMRTGCSLPDAVSAEPASDATAQETPAACPPVSSPPVHSPTADGSTENRAGLRADPWLGPGLIMLHGILFVGVHFGRLPRFDALLLLLAPCLALFPEHLPCSRSRSARVRTLLGLLTMAVPLALLLVFAKSAFDQRMGPLLAPPRVESPSPGIESNRSRGVGR